MARVVIVSNRVPIPKARVPAAGGLTVALRDLLIPGALWFGWSGRLSPEPSLQPALVEARGVTYATDAGEHLSGVDLLLRRGEAVAIAGEEGAGKTLLADLLARWEKRGGPNIGALAPDKLDIEGNLADEDDDPTNDAALAPIFSHAPGRAVALDVHEHVRAERAREPRARVVQLRLRAQRAAARARLRLRRRAQLYAAAVAAHPQIPADITRGKFDTLHGWLRNNLYRHGAKFPPADVIERATGKHMSTAPYLAYLKAKYGELYGLAAG